MDQVVLPEALVVVVQDRSAATSAVAQAEPPAQGQPQPSRVQALLWVAAAAAVASRLRVDRLAGGVGTGAVPVTPTTALLARLIPAAGAVEAVARQAFKVRQAQAVQVS